MKKRILLLLAAVLCVCLCACGGSESTSGNNIIENQNDTNDFERGTTKDGNVLISSEEIGTYITKVELTLENWTEYIDIVEQTKEEKNAFGEVTDTKTSNEWIVKNAQLVYFDGLAIELTVNETGETIIMESSGSGSDITPEHSVAWFYSQNFSMNDLTCNRVIGDLYILNAPKDVWSVNEDGEEVIYMYYMEGNTRYIETLSNSKLKDCYELNK